MRFRKDTFGSISINILACCALSAKVASPTLQEFGVHIPKYIGFIGIGLMLLGQNLMITYKVPDLPKDAPKVFNNFNFFVGLALLFIMNMFFAYMEVYPVKLSNLYISIFFVISLFMTSLCVNFAIVSYENLLRKHGVEVSTASK